MMNLNSILLFSENPDKLSDFYKKVLEKDPEWDEMEYKGFKIGDGFLTIGYHEKVKGKNQSPERMLINFETKEVNKEFDRLKGLGVKVIAEPYNPGEDKRMTIATLEDIDGNYFQLITPMEM